MKNELKICGLMFLGFLVVGSCSTIAYVGGFFGEGATVVREEFGPRTSLKKYEWFKDAAAQLAKKSADIDVVNAQITQMREVPRIDMDRFDKEQLFQLIQERNGILMSYNQLAAEYNAAMAKVNYRYANLGELPEGADKVLPRNFAEMRVK